VVVTGVLVGLKEILNRSLSRKRGGKEENEMVVYRLSFSGLRSLSALMVSFFVIVFFHPLWS